MYFKITKLNIIWFYIVLLQYIKKHLLLISTQMFCLVLIVDYPNKYDQVQENTIYQRIYPYVVYVASAL